MIGLALSTEYQTSSTLEWLPLASQKCMIGDMGVLGYGLEHA